MNKSVVEIFSVASAYIRHLNFLPGLSTRPIPKRVSSKKAWKKRGKRKK